MFAKVKPEPVTDTNVRDIVQVTTMRDAPAQSLYNNLHSIYCPILLKDSKLDTKLQKIIGVLDSQLGHALNSGSALGLDPFDKKVLGSVLRPSDEFELWSELCNSRKYRSVARVFSDSFSQIQDRFKNLNSLNFAEIEELLMDTQSVLDDVWKADDVDTKYPQHRMKHLLGVLGNAFVRAIQSKVQEKDMDIWKGSFSDVSSRLREATTICTKWVEVVTELTDSFWPTFESHAWTGKPYRCTTIEDYSIRLEEILRVRTTHEELTDLLRESGNVEDTKRVDPFEPFESIRPLQYNRYTDGAWQDALKEFERRLQPLEHRIASNLRAKISKLSDRPKQHLREFLQYRTLVERPSISKLLRGEREILLNRLSDYLTSLERQFEHQIDDDVSDTKTSSSRGKNQPQIVDRLVWAKQLEVKIHGLQTHAKKILHDLSGFEEFQGNVEHLYNKTKNWRRSQFVKWRDQTEDQVRDGELSLKMTGRLMYFDTDGELQVGFSDSLVQMLREVRMLRELGYDVPRVICQSATDAEKYYRFGVLLKKTANFYNSMESRIISTQRPMLLKGLLKFERTLKRKDGDGSDRSVSSSDSTKGYLTWSKPRECEDYVERLQHAAEELLRENRRLRKSHEWFRDGVCALARLDLLKDPNRWMKKWNELKSHMDTLTKTYTRARMKDWILFWDHQVYVTRFCFLLLFRCVT